MWRLGRWRGDRRLFSAAARRSFSAASRRRLDDEGDWSYSPEWWDSESDGHTVFRSSSDHGNGVVSVVAHPSSRPAPEHWVATEAWLQQRHAKIHPKSEHDGQFKILNYQWRTLRFNDNTRQSTTKIMSTYRKSDPTTLYLMQQSHCLAIPYLKSMVSAGLTTLTSSGYDLHGSIIGKRSMNVLCIGHGGGTLPLFLASKIKGATVHIVEIDPVVISASIQAMGFPASAVREPSEILSFTQPADADRLLYGDIHQRLFLHRSYAEDFVLADANTYDLVFIDAYDGDDIFHRKLWDPDASFLGSLRSRLHPVHGTVVVNLHSDADEAELELTDSILPMGKYVSQVCEAYKVHLGMAFTVSVPYLCNVSLVACSGLGFGCGGRNGMSVTNYRDLVLNGLLSKSNMVEFLLDLPFPCLEYIKRGFALVR